MKFQRIGKILLFISAGLLGLLALGIVLLFMALPSPSKIKETFKLKSQAELHGPATLKAPGKDLAENGIEVSLDSEVPPKTKEDQKYRDSLVALENLTDSRKPLSDACRTMSRIESKQMGKMDSEEFGRRFQDSLLDKNSDPLMESLKPVLKQVLTQPKMKSLLEMVQEAPPNEHSSLMGKLDFYRAAYSAYLEMVQNQENMEKTLDQSYLTMMMGRAVEARPELLGDSRVLRYCEDLEKVLNEGSRVNFSDEKKAFSKFLSEAKLNPKTIGFDENYQTQLNIVFDKTGLHFNGGWMDQVFSQLKKDTDGN